MSEPLILKDFDNAIAPSAHKGFGLMRCVDIGAFPGAAKVKNAPTSLFLTSFSGTFTAVAATDVCTAASLTLTTLHTGAAVTVSTTTTLPAGLSASTNYFMIYVSATTFKLATTIANANAGTAINITDAGTGTHTVTSVNPGTINHIARDPRSFTQFLHDSNARVWYYDSANVVCKLLNGNTLTNGSGQGLQILPTSDATASYLFVFRNATIDVINVFGTTNKETPVWTTAWQVLNSSAGDVNSRHAVFGQDNIIYYCDGRYIGSIRELTVFDPSSSATYTFNYRALDLPNGEIANWLEELGKDLLIAGLTFNRIYPWDRISDSFALPIQVPERIVYRLKNVNNTVYVLAGNSGNVYVTQGTYCRHFKKLPEQITNNSGSLLSGPVTWGGVGALGTAFIFGVGCQTSGNSGVYLLYPDGRLVIDQVPSTGSANVTALMVADSFYVMGYSAGADIQSSSRYSNFEAVIQSALERVATKTQKGSYSTLQVYVAKTTGLGQGSGHVRISYRPDTDSSFTTLDSYTTGAAPSFETAVGLTDLENIQIQIEMDGTAELIEVRLLP